MVYVQNVSQNSSKFKHIKIHHSGNGNINKQFEDICNQVSKVKGA